MSAAQLEFREELRAVEKNTESLLQRLDLKLDQFTYRVGVYREDK